MSDSNPAPVTSEIAVAALDDDAPQRRGGRFKPGNPGKPKGARHKTTCRPPGSDYYAAGWPA